MQFFRMCLLSILISPLVGCDNDDSGAEGAYTAAKRQWDDQQIVNYRYTVSIEKPHPALCFSVSDTYPGCGFYVATVKGGIVESAERTGSGEALNEDQLKALATVNDLFSVIEDAIERQAAAIDVDYNPQYGYPQSIFIDNRTDVADDERLFHASGLVPIAP